MLLLSLEKISNSTQKNDVVFFSQYAGYTTNLREKHICDPLPQKGYKVARADTSYRQEVKDNRYVHHLTHTLQLAITLLSFEIRA